MTFFVICFDSERDSQGSGQLDGAMAEQLLSTYDIV